MLLFIAVYVFTCLIGAVILLAGWHPFVVLFEYFSGSRVPALSPAQRSIDLILLVLAPLLFVVGYVAGMRLPLPDRARARLTALIERVPDGQRPGLAWSVFFLSFAVAMFSLLRARTISDVSTWLNYSEWVQARARTFQRISFFEFANIYMVLPVAAAWATLAFRPARLRARLLGVLPLLLVLGADFLLFQRKQAIVSVIIVISAWLLFHRGRASRRAVTVGAAAVVVVGAGLYLAGSVFPVLSRASHTLCGVRGVDCGTVGRVSPVLVYSVISPATRTAGPALYYPVIYPGKHSFYGPDFGQDIAGIGRSPDDNIVVWRYVYRNGFGTIVAPFQFNLYAQMGVWGALMGSVVVGALLALGWRAVGWLSARPTWGSLGGALVLLLAVYLAGDTFRNSTIVTYGVLWGGCFVCVAMLASRYVKPRSRAV